MGAYIACPNCAQIVTRVYPGSKWCVPCVEAVLAEQAIDDIAVEMPEVIGA